MTQPYWEFLASPTTKTTGSASTTPAPRTDDGSNQ